MTGGCIIGTRDIYEYAATVIAPTRAGLSFINLPATKIAVGPSAAPIIPIEAAAPKSNPNSRAIIIVAKIPNWAAAPKNNMNGFCNNGPKSIIAPTAIKISTGNKSLCIPLLYRKVNTP
ncbi:MAG: hypothetical protein BWY74_03994 [Firmicutes bacterium ADurb.Bin419]|nr:MAG: hypothetical protein BWY74_03994 [Firmicutes bacterium ADurb.Bin419]